MAFELQLKRGHRVDLNETLSFLIDQCGRNVELLEAVCKPISGVKEALDKLQMERKQDELRLERKIGSRRHHPA